MLYHPMSRYHVATSHQQEWWREAEMDHLAQEATRDQPDLVERVLHHVWKRLGLPARKVVSRPLPAPSDGLPPLPAEACGPIQPGHRGNPRGGGSPRSREEGKEKAA